MKETHPSEEKGKTICDFPIKKVKMKDEIQNNKEMNQFFYQDFDFGMEFKSYFPQFNLGKILQRLNCLMELNSPKNSPRNKSRPRLSRKSFKKQLKKVCDF